MPGSVALSAHCSSRRWSYGRAVLAITAAKSPKSVTALTAKAFPPRVDRNSARGSRKGVRKDAQVPFTRHPKRREKWMTAASRKRVLDEDSRPCEATAARRRSAG